MRNTNKVKIFENEIIAFYRQFYSFWYHIFFSGNGKKFQGFNFKAQNFSILSHKVSSLQVRTTPIFCHVLFRRYWPSLITNIKVFVDYIKKQYKRNHLHIGVQDVTLNTNSPNLNVMGLLSILASRPIDKRIKSLASTFQLQTDLSASSTVGKLSVNQ